MRIWYDFLQVFQCEPMGFQNNHSSSKITNETPQGVNSGSYRLILTSWPWLYLILAQPKKYQVSFKPKRIIVCIYMHTKCQKSNSFCHTLCNLIQWEIMLQGWILVYFQPFICTLELLNKYSLKYTFTLSEYSWNSKACQLFDWDKKDVVVNNNIVLQPP
jgi:hypothetical protein